MKFGVALSTGREGLFYPVGFTSPAGLLEVTRRAEELGYYSVWGNDHITTQSYIKKRGERPNFFEPMVTFAYLSALATRITFGTGVVIGPTKNPVTLAKQAITLDHLTKGRFILGIGLGAYREEFESFGGAGPRGKILDELIQGLILLLSTEKSASFRGRYFTFTDIEMFPKPLTRPFPVYVGGNSAEVLRRVGSYAQGWIPADLSPEELHKGIQKIAEHAKKSGRDPSKIEVAPEGFCAVDNDPRRARQTFLKSLMYEHTKSLSKSTLKDIPLDADSIIGRNFIGSPSEIIKRVESHEKVGVGHLWFDFLGSTNEEVLRQMQLFAKEVMPSF